QEASAPLQAWKNRPRNQLPDLIRRLAAPSVDRRRHFAPSTSRALEQPPMSSDIRRREKVARPTQGLEVDERQPETVSGVGRSICATPFLRPDGAVTPDDS